MKSVLLQCTELVLYLRIVLNSIKTNAKQATYDIHVIEFKNTRTIQFCVYNYNITSTGFNI